MDQDKRALPKIGLDAVYLIKCLSTNGGEGTDYVDIAPYRESHEKANLANAVDELVSARIAEAEPHMETDEHIKVRLVPGYNLVGYERPNE